MRVYTFILYILLVLQSVSVNSAAKYSYNHPTYGDRSFREYGDAETFDTEYGNGERRFRKYHPSYRYRPSRSGRERHGIDHDRQRAYYNEPGRQDDPSIEVIVDPGKKKAVAVIENGPAGQSRYELTGYEMAKQPEMQSAILDNAAGHSERKRSQKIGDSEKQKRNAELTKRKINKASKMAQVPFKQEYADDQVAGLPTKRKSEDSKDTAVENCPPHLEEQVKDQKRNEAGMQSNKNSVKREVANVFSESQLTMLTDTLARVKDSSEDVENLKRVLYDMGLVQNTKRNVKETMEKQQTKRDLQTEDEDLNKDNVVMKRDSEAGDEEAWGDGDDNEEEFDEQMDKRDAEADNWEDREEDDEMADEPVDKMNYGTGEAKMNNEDSVKETAELPMRDKRQNKESQENAEENQNEMIDNYAKELEQSNLEAAARSKREQDKTKAKQDKDNTKRSNKDEDKLIQEAESQVTPDNNKADDKKKLTKRDDAKEAKEKRQENDETKKKMESEIKEKIQMIKEKVKREILEANAENSRDGYYKDANFQRNNRAADSMDLDGSFKRSKRDLSGSKENHDELKNRRANTDGNVTKVAIDYKYNQTDQVLNNSKALDPVVESHDLKPIVRQHRQVNVTGVRKIDDTAEEHEKQSDDCKVKDLTAAAAVRKRRDTATNAKEMEQQKVIRQKRANGDPEKQMVYEPFQNGEVDETEEEGEFGDNYKDNRLYIDKRQTRNEEDYFEEPREKGDEQYEERDGSYFAGENNSGRRHRSFEDEDTARIRTDDREKREPLNAKLTDEEKYSENLYFGPLSKTYNEDLVRYKRVKRDKP